MLEKSGRPVGARKDDFEKLNDWTVTDIATAPNTAPEDQANAEAEIAKRKMAGTYDVENAPHETKKDFLGHGYGIDEYGKVLYPKPEYQEWLESDRKGERPRGEVRESIDDRLEAERIAIEKEIADDERKQERDRIVGEIAFENSKKETAGKAVHHQGRMPRINEDIMRERRKREKASDIRRNMRRNVKEATKYDDSFSNPRKMQEAEIRANMPILEDVEPPVERTRNLESVEERIEKLFNQYADGFAKNAPKWATVGVTNSLEKGKLDGSKESLIRSGFWAREDKRIHKRIDPDDSFAPETIQAESNLKVRVSKDLIDERSEELTDLQFKKAQHDGIIYAIESGARVEKQTGKVVYAINPEIKDEILPAMEDVEIDATNENIIRKSFQGFAGILEAIKNKPNETKQGFEMLDWYFDNFDYADRLAEEDGFLDHLKGYETFADKAWSDKLYEYLDTRKEYQDFINKQNSEEQAEKDVEAIERSEPISPDEYIHQVAESLGVSEEELRDLQLSANYIIGKVLPPEPTQRIITGHGGNSIRYPRTFGRQKILATYAAWAVIRASGADPDAQIFQELNGSAITLGGDIYTILRFGCANNNGEQENHAIAEADSPAAATYTWHGHGDGWKGAFINRYKRQAKLFPGVNSKNHDHSRSPMDHLITILGDMSIDLPALANNVLANIQNAATGKIDEDAM